jgi:hypothetical protein
MSAAGTPTFTGGPSSVPVTLMSPLMACTTPSTPGRSFHGPCCPKAEMLQYTRRGLRVRRVSAPSPKRSATPGRKLSTNTSAPSASRRRTCRPSGRFRSTTTLRLLRFIPT